MKSSPTEYSYIFINFLNLKYSRPQFFSLYSCKLVKRLAEKGMFNGDRGKQRPFLEGSNQRQEFNETSTVTLFLNFF